MSSYHNKFYYRFIACAVSTNKLIASVIKDAWKEEAALGEGVTNGREVLELTSSSVVITGAMIQEWNYASIQELIVI